MFAYVCTACGATENRHGSPKYGGRKVCRACGGELALPAKPPKPTPPVIERESTGWRGLDDVADLTDDQFLKLLADLGCH